jgi:hemoglobin-like flavoprotein
MTISESVELLLSSKARVTERFYSLLLSRHPELKALFARRDMRMQATMLTMALATAESYSVHRYPAIAHYFQVLGHRHYHAGVRVEDFAKFKSALLEVLAEFHGADWTDDLAEQWRTALQEAITKMEDGYRESFIY